MNNTQLSRAGPSAVGGAVTRFSKRIARKPTVLKNNENENNNNNNNNNTKKVTGKGNKGDQENDVEAIPSKGLKRSTSATQVRNFCNFESMDY